MADCAFNDAHIPALYTALENMQFETDFLIVRTQSSAKLFVAVCQFSGIAANAGWHYLAVGLLIIFFEDETSHKYESDLPCHAGLYSKKTTCLTLYGISSCASTRRALSVGMFMAGR